jgi:methylamine dehydrogenase accessory protein MauD
MNAIWVTAFVALWLLTLFIGFVLIGALRTLAVVQWRLENLIAVMPSRVGRAGLKLGKKAPDFTLPNMNGQRVSLHDFAGKKLLLVFMQPGCGPCNGVVSDLSAFQEKKPISILVVQKGNADEVRKWAHEKEVRFPVALQEKDEISRKYETFATPFAFLVNESGIIESKGVINNGKHIQLLLSGRRVLDGSEQSDKETDVSQEDPPTSKKAEVA